MLPLTRHCRDIPGVKQEDINLEIDGPVVRVRRVRPAYCVVTGAGIGTDE